MISWETPEHDSRARNRGRWQEIAEALKERPGEWALVAENEWAGGAASRLQALGCEVTCRGVKNGKAAKVYARHIVVENLNIEERF